MKIPKTIKIGGMIYKVIMKPCAEIDSECNAGWARHQEQEIILGSDLPQESKERNLIHEILHCFDNGATEEKEIGFLANCLYQVLKDNDLLKC